MKRFFLLTIILTVVVAGEVGAQEAASASKRANQQYVLFESERDKGTNVTAMYDYLMDSYENFMKVVEAPDNSQYIGGAKNRLKALYPYLLNGAVYYSEQKQPSQALILPLLILICRRCSCSAANCCRKITDMLRWCITQL